MDNNRNKYFLPAFFIANLLYMVPLVDGIALYLLCAKSRLPGSAITEQNLSQFPIRGFPRRWDRYFPRLLAWLPRYIGGTESWSSWYLATATYRWGKKKFQIWSG